MESSFSPAGPGSIGRPVDTPDVASPGERLRALTGQGGWFSASAQGSHQTIRASDQHPLSLGPDQWVDRILARLG